MRIEILESNNFVHHFNVFENDKQLDYSQIKVKNGSKLSKNIELNKMIFETESKKEIFITINKIDNKIIKKYSRILIINQSEILYEILKQLGYRKQN